MAAIINLTIAYDKRTPTPAQTPRHRGNAGEALEVRVQLEVL
jgi:hypothetical protein